MKEVTIFLDIITEQYVTDRPYIEEMIMNQRVFDYANEGMSPVNETCDVQHYPVESYSWSTILEGKYNPDGSQAYHTETFYYAATKQFKEKFKVFFDAHNALKNENATNKYYREASEKENSDYIKKIYSLQLRNARYEQMTFWERLKFLFSGEV
jgi:hypothetical protein